ncbi:MAG: sulfatase [Planctomycetia bacterium]|nr:sulfatase [Planctomycetia bacterium]
MRHIILTLAALCALAAPSLPAADEPPNIVVILADDLGYGDLSCYGHPTIRTPHLDRLAAEGMRFTQFYSAAEVCTPSRAALLTGRYPIRSGMCHDQFRVLRTRSTGGLPADEVTLAELLKARGYATACIGKWHLGVFSINSAHHPKRHGFDHFFGLPHSNDMDPSPQRPQGASGRLDQDPAWWNSPLYRDEELVERPADQTTLTRRYTEEAVAFIRQNKSRPFFLYFPHTFPHVPLFASERFKSKSPRGLFGDVVEELDWSVGHVLEALRAEGLDKKTLVFFTSDNGPWLIQKEAGGSAGLLTDGKGSTWEGGLRVPGIACWPGRIAAGSTQREMATMMDLMPTCAKLAGAEVPADRPIDGVDIAPILFGKGSVPRETFFYYRGQQLYAARKGVYKAHVLTRPGYGPEKPQAHDPPLLFDVERDPGEHYNVAAAHPDVVKEILADIERHKADLKAPPSQLQDVAAP